MRKGPKIGGRANPGFTTVTSKPSLEIDPRLLRQIRALGGRERQLIGQAIEEARLAWGTPHRHAGAGARKLTSGFFECRCGLKIRLVFEELPDGRLYFHLMGNHDEIRRFIKSI